MKSSNHIHTTPCPKCGYSRQPQDSHILAELCPSCGIAIQKWLDRERTEEALAKDEKPLLAEPPTASDPLTPLQGSDTPHNSSGWQHFKKQVSTTNSASEARFWLNLVLYVVFLLWGFNFIFMGIDWNKVGGSFLHGPDLIFHEAGHVLFMPLGRFMSVLGGSLFQILLPVLLTLAFIYKNRDQFSASITFWWAGQNCIDVAPYIDDARARQLPLLGGNEAGHDWYNLLSQLGLLDWDHFLARCVYAAGVLVILSSFYWGASALLQQKQALK